MKFKNMLLALFGILIILSLTSMVSSLSFDNVKSYDKDKNEITITNAFGLGSDLAKYRLTYNTEQCLINCYAEGEVNLLTPAKLFDSIFFKDKESKTKNINSNLFLIINNSYTIKVPEYKEVCDKNLSCSQEQIGTKDVLYYQEDKVKYNGQVLPIGNYKWKIEGNKNVRDNIDWIGNSMGVSLDSWAWWSNNWSRKQVINIFTNLSSVQNQSVLINVTYNSAMKTDFGDLRFLDSSETQEIGYWFYNDTCITGNSCQIWLNVSTLTNTVNKTYYMYYNNSGASTTSSISQAFLYGDNTDRTESTYLSGAWIVNPASRSWGNQIIVEGRIRIDTNANNNQWGMDVILNPTPSGTSPGNQEVGSSTGSSVARMNGVSATGTANTNWNRGEIKINGSTSGYAAMYSDSRDTTSVSKNAAAETSSVFYVHFRHYSDTTPSIGYEDWYYVRGYTDQEAGFSFGNITLITFNTSITVVLNSPNTGYSNILTSLNFSANVSILNANQSNATLYIWRNNGTIYSTNTNNLYGFANNTDQIGITNTTNFSKILAIGNYIWNVYGCYKNETGNGCIFGSNRTFTIGAFTENSINFTNPVYETAYERFILNTTYDNSLYNLTGSFYYNGTFYTATKTGSSSEGILTSYVSIPTTTTAVNRTFYWQVGLTNVTGTFYYNSSVTNQTVQVINLTICAGAPQNIPYINFTFKDETTNANINVSVDSSTWSYYLGDGSVKKTLSYTSSGNQNANYSFCFAPSDKTIYTDLTFKYASTSYPQRTYSLTNQSLTNSTTATILYLLSTTNGIYTSIQTLTTAGSVISGVTILLERISGSTYTTVGSGTTDSAGIITFFVDFNSDHRITATKTGYVSTQVTIRPTQAIYSLFMGSSSGNASYSDPISGLVWRLYPASGIINSGTRNFNATITSSQLNLENCRYDLVNQSNISQVFATNTAITNSSYCFVQVSYNVRPNVNMFGQLLVDTTSTNGFVYVDADTSYLALDINASSWQSFTSFFSDLNDLNEFGEGNEGEFSRFMFFFIIITILMCVFIYISGIEMANPGISILIVWGIVVFATMGGFLTITMGSSNADSFMAKTSLLWILTFIMIGYVFDTIRRSSG